MTSTMNAQLSGSSTDVEQRLTTVRKDNDSYRAPVHPCT
jgi:hypothetical protein